jgi:hypothetical protein
MSCTVQLGYGAMLAPYLAVKRDLERGEIALLHVKGVNLQVAHLALYQGT